MDQTVSALPEVDVAVVGAGPAGLMAAEVLAGAGCRVRVFEGMPTPARKLLLAGRGGLNLTHSEPLPRLVERYGTEAARFAGWIDAFTPADLRAWAEGLGEETFVGSSGRVFPARMKASGLVRAWLRRLEGLGVDLRTRHRWLGWDEDAALRFSTPDGEVRQSAGRVLLALGGASWPRTGSDAAWVPLLEARGVAVTPFRPANMGFERAWSERFLARAEGQPVKSVGLSVAGRSLKGEFIVTRTGIEGSAAYALGAPLRDAIARDGAAVLTLDLLPDLDAAAVTARLARPQGSDSLTNHRRKALRLPDAQFALLRELTSAEEFRDPRALAGRVKALPLRLTGVRPLERAISSAGGIPFAEIDDALMLKRLPGVHVAGEMLDWEAPTGGYLLQGCFSMAVRAASGILGGDVGKIKVALKPDF